MQLRQLEAFYWIARLGRFHAAARHLHVAQPSISARVRELEKHLGVALFDRGGRGVRPTAKGRVRFGVTSIPAVTWMPKAMRRLAQAYPGIEAEFVVDSSETMRAHLLRGELDLAFLAGPIAEPTVTTRPLSRTTMAWVASPELALPAGHEIPVGSRAVLDRSGTSSIIEAALCLGE